MFSLLLVFCLLTCGLEPEPQADSLLTGRRFQQALQGSMTLQFAGYSVRNILADLQKETRVAILCDRRVNPNRQPAISVQNASRLEALQQIANRCEARVEIVDNVAVIMPADVTGKLAERIDALRKKQIQMRGQLASKVLSALARKRPCQWPRLTKPREFLIQRSQEAGLSMVNPEAIPHDLWPAAKLPSANYATAMTLVLSQFDLTYQLNADATIQIVPAS